ncbi:zinc finger BED domain-containing protein 5 [Trichonephila clavipes]|nr:zinc finger BED domain-containing protein 5 [Trichonephila clavipes]
MGEELILPAIEEVLKTVTPKSASDIIRIPLSTVQRRIDEMSQDVESFLCDYLQTTHFSLQLDESTLPGNNHYYWPMFVLLWIRSTTKKCSLQEL